MSSVAALRMAGGIAVWALHFTVVYGATALACAREAVDSRWIVIAATVVALVACAMLFAHAWPRRRRFHDWLTAAVAAISMLAIAWEGIASLVAGVCR